MSTPIDPVAILPPALDAGDAVSIIAPSGPINTDALQHAIRVLEGIGLRCVTYRDLSLRIGYLAGDDDVRAGELNAAINDPSTRAILPVRGGYGVSRLLHLVDFAPLADRPKVVCGYSDITAMHLAIWQQAKLVTFHGPNLQDGIGGNEGLDTESASHYWKALTGKHHRRLFPNASDAINPLKVQTVVAGACEAPLVGGNLAVMCGLMGTAAEIDCEGKVLLIEDIHEEPYRIDRMLSQLRLSGKLQQLAGIIIGDFKDCDTSGDDRQSLPQLFQSYFGDLGVPVVQTSAIGHSQPNLTLPLGHPIRIDTQSQTLSIGAALSAMDASR